MKKAFAYICVFAIAGISKAQSQSLRYNISMPYVSLGAYSTKQADPFAFTNNQAALASVKNSSIGIFGERRFLLQENAVYGTAVTIKTDYGNFGVQANYAGFKNFNENKLGLAYGRSLGSAVDIGVQFNYYGYRIPGYNSASAINFEGGIIVHLTGNLNAGIHAYNPVGGNLGKKTDNEKLASAFKFGLGYDASDNFYVSAEIVKEENKPINVIGGVQYKFANQFFARTGFLSETGSGFAGFGVAFRQMRIDISASYHPQLGISPGILFIADLKKSK